MAGRSTFLAESRISWMSRADADSIHTAIVATCRRLSEAGDQVYCVRSVFLPGARHWFAMFVAENPHVVRRVVGIVQLPAVSVHAVVEFAGAADGSADAQHPSAQMERSHYR